MSDATPDPYLKTAQSLENMLKHNDITQFQNTLHKEIWDDFDSAKEYNVLRDLARLNKEDIKKQPDMPGIDLYGREGVHDSSEITAAHLTTPGNLFGNLWRNDTVLNGPDSDHQALLDPAKMGDYFDGFQKPLTAAELETSLKKGNAKDFRDDLELGLLDQITPEEAAPVLKQLVDLNAADRAKDPSVPEFVTKVVGANLTELDLIDSGNVVLKDYWAMHSEQPVKKAK